MKRSRLSGECGVRIHVEANSLEEGRQVAKSFAEAYNSLGREQLVGPWFMGYDDADRMIFSTFPGEKGGR